MLRLKPSIWTFCTGILILVSAVLYFSKSEDLTAVDQPNAADIAVQPTVIPQSRANKHTKPGKIFLHQGWFALCHLKFRVSQ